MAAMEGDADHAGGVVGVDVTEIAIVGPDAEVGVCKSIDTEPDAVAEVVVLDRVYAIDGEIAPDPSKPGRAIGPEAGAALTSDRYADDERRPHGEYVVVAEAVIAAEEVPGVSHVHFGAEDTLERPADCSTPRQAAAIVEGGAQRASGISREVGSDE